MSEQQNLNQTMLSNEQLDSLKQAVSDYSPLQLAWVSGYLAAQSEGIIATVLPTSTSTSTEASSILTILYGSQTGNAKGVAKTLAEQAQAQGVVVDCKNMSEFKPKSIKNVNHLLIVASTNGEGEAPDDAIALHEFLQTKKAPNLDHLHYSVLALGDTSYEFFCQTGKDFDQYLAALGAKPMHPRVDCDVDYEEEVSTWSSTVIKKIQDMLGSEQINNVVALPTVSAPNEYTKQTPYVGELITSQRITGCDSNKEVCHIEIDLADSGITYQAGDALGVWFDNDVELVAELMAALGIDPHATVTLGDSTGLIKEVLTSTFDITQTSVNFVCFWAQHSQNEKLLAVVADKNAIRDYAAKHQVIDVVRAAPAKVDAQALVDALRKITPRLYSIASSQAEVEDEVHLTVGLVKYHANDRPRMGGASGFLAKRLQEGGEVKVFIEHNDNFRLPENGNTPVIMIGPGTGIAPFRSFMQEREAQQAKGDNWLFFGDQTFTQDFLYQVEWQGYLKSGLLTKIDLAFSRDQTKKIYVQHRLLENAEELFSWLERGAHLYICGDMSRMAKDVELALVDIISKQGQLTEEQARQYLKDLRNAKRYQKDVY